VTGYTLYGDSEYYVKVDAVKNATSTPPTSQGSCYVVGCSAQVCSDTEDLATTCEWKEEYACYKSATCKRQTSGQCGWTETAELKMCLGNARQ